MSKKHKKPQWRQEGGRMVATVVLTNKEIAANMHRAGRERDRAAGILGKRRSGGGYHGGGDVINNRRDRRDAKVNLNKGRFDG